MKIGFVQFFKNRFRLVLFNKLIFYLYHCYRMIEFDDWRVVTNRE